VVARPGERTQITALVGEAVKLLGLVDDQRELVRRLAAGGWLRYAVGERLDVRSLCLIRETLARTNALADFAFALHGLGSGPISLFGTDEQRRAWLTSVNG